MDLFQKRTEHALSPLGQASAEAPKPLLPLPRPVQLPAPAPRRLPTHADPGNAGEGSGTCLPLTHSGSLDHVPAPGCSPGPARRACAGQARINSDSLRVEMERPDSPFPPTQLTAPSDCFIMGKKMNAYKNLNGKKLM